MAAPSGRVTATPTYPLVEARCSGRRSLVPAHRCDLDGLGYALERQCRPWECAYLGSESVGEVSADEDLVGCGESSDACGYDHVTTGLVVIDDDCRSRVQSDSHTRREPVGSTMGGERALDGDRTCNSKCRVIEGDKVSVARLLDGSP